ncbi:bifunctional glutamine synthetase adenylyltransferase/deadenyltransferase [Wohlfahrtiimonas chitiniclastica]|uniref:bifunctional [glutamate--ammonia ligase]-adenylyl-L-tyrosine phosphorylase/[glutamate--ammonia-ligase] adenylyltransferase n=1 Tax=Wohlfahrtiimonas chitiniclastica TaxID=400946 RepID=UPI000B9865AC|nr:bifunctional [glutamate--ammonia ligase]-adenylyl-L-tyrosine phosphorylase/[glutamate--ammonia-ligase] adenylyltransferase [Wohlfahrtiimonas chitiniclastica]OYQ77720.1 bifunctional glutamine synthetase adenylyltransferase/deadenyltransferase [Wohlfahrtiimonas chitiniclastica]
MLNYWLQFEERHPQLYHTVETHPDFLALNRLLESSPWAGRLILNRPERYLTDFLSQQWDAPLDLSSLVITAHSEAEALPKLRTLRNQLLLKMAYRDINQIDDVLTINRDITRIADFFCQQALNLAYQFTTKNTQAPMDQHGRPIVPYIIGMGKMGGFELNFSSDIDLIFGYSGDDAHFFHKVARRFIHLLHTTTEDGFVYRVDLRLRPFGSSGPIALSTVAMVSYYFQYGRDWERYALIKARVVAGNMTEGEHFLKEIHPFIYRKTIDYELVDALKNIKDMIQKEVILKDNHHNIKLGDGGIREIEFIAQVFQLIHGGKQTQLQTTEIMQALDVISTRYLSPETVSALKNAYIFYRLIENRLQMVHDEQTHTLPSTPAEQARLIHGLNIASWENFTKTLMYHQSIVHEEFENIFGAVTVQESDNHFTSLLKLLREPQEAIDFKKWFDLQNARESEQKSYLLWAFQKETFLKADLETQKSLTFILLHAFHYLETKQQHSAHTLNLFLDILASIAQKSRFIEWLHEYNSALIHVLDLCCHSTFLSRYLARFPKLFDELMVSMEDAKPFNHRKLSKALNTALEQPKATEEQRLNLLRDFLHKTVLKIAMADFSGKMPLMIVSDYLSELADTLLNKILRLAWSELSQKHGQPTSLRHKNGRPDFIIVAYGKLGGLELGYQSDLDIIFLHDAVEDQMTDGAHPIFNSDFFVKLAQKIIHYLTAQTASGRLYEVDMRLRPCGDSGLLVSSFERFKNYQANDAWIWEHQALIRARPITGSQTLSNAFNQFRKEILTRQRSIPHLKQEIIKMRQKLDKQFAAKQSDLARNLKYGKGGMIDIEFLVQYLVLSHAYHEPLLVRFTDNIRQLAALEALGRLSSWEAMVLRDTYRSIRKIQHYARLSDQETLQKPPELVESMQLVKEIHDKVFGQTSHKKIN